jgi:hypothetical protein
MTTKEESYGQSAEVKIEVAQRTRGNSQARAHERQTQARAEALGQDQITASLQRPYTFDQLLAVVSKTIEH